MEPFFSFSFFRILNRDRIGFLFHFRFSQVDVSRIRDIVNLNAFGGAVQTFFSKAKLQDSILAQRGQDFSGLWLLPSFINHSCFPNSKWLELGSAMFIHASKPIKRGEEITISYFDTLVPLPRRRAMCSGWGFKCKCRRGILEHSLAKSLEQLHDKAKLVLVAARSLQQHFDANLPACTEFARLSADVEATIRSSLVLKTEEEKNWIRASFVSAYLAAAESKTLLSTMLNGCFPSWQKVMEAIQSTVPGDIRNLVMAARLLKGLQPWMDDENAQVITRYASDMAREACISVFGKHTEDVLRALVFKNSNRHLF